MPDYRYRLTLTGASSQKYGPCEVCGGHASEVFHQVEERRCVYWAPNGVLHQGWTRQGCKDVFGHRECLRGDQP